MKKLFKELKPGDTIFLVGSLDFIVHEDLPENFSVFKIERIINTQDGKGVPIVCLRGNCNEASNVDVSKVAYFTAPEDSEISGHQASVRLDEWSERFTKTISSYHTFLCFPNIATGLDFLEARFKKYQEDIKECREINRMALEGTLDKALEKLQKEEGDKE